MLTTLAILFLSPERSHTLLQSLRIMGVGMVGIIAFMALFYFMIKGLMRLFPGAPAEAADEA